MKKLIYGIAVLCMFVQSGYAAQREQKQAAAFDISDIYFIVVRGQASSSHAPMFQAFLKNGNEVHAMKTNQGRKQVSLFIPQEGGRCEKKILRSSRYDEIQKHCNEWRVVEGDIDCRCAAHRSKNEKNKQDEDKWDGEL